MKIRPGIARADFFCRIEECPTGNPQQESMLQQEGGDFPALLPLLSGKRRFLTEPV